MELKSLYFSLVYVFLFSSETRIYIYIEREREREREITSWLVRLYDFYSRVVKNLFIIYVLYITEILQKLDIMADIM